MENRIREQGSADRTAVGIRYRKPRKRGASLKSGGRGSNSRPSASGTSSAPASSSPSSPADATGSRRGHAADCDEPTEVDSSALQRASRRDAEEGTHPQKMTIVKTRVPGGNTGSRWADDADVPVLAPRHRRSPTHARPHASVRQQHTAGPRPRRPRRRVRRRVPDVPRPRTSVRQRQHRGGEHHRRVRPPRRRHADRAARVTVRRRRRRQRSAGRITRIAATERRRALPARHRSGQQPDLGPAHPL